MRQLVRPSLDLPFKGFPLRRHPNGQWYKSVWNPRTKRSEQHYFGTWRDDPKGDRAINDPDSGWLARRDAIKAGVDNPRIAAIAENDMLLGELMARFLTHKRAKVTSGELSLTTLKDYLHEIQRFVEFMKTGTPASGLRPEHFSGYMQHLISKRELGRRARKRVRAYVMAFLRFGAKNGWFPLPNVGVDWAAPSTDPDSMRQAKARTGQKDFSDRILTGEEVDKMIERSQPSMRAMILLGVNAGLGPADIGRLTWKMIDLDRGYLVYPRPKTGAMRVGFLWKKTRKALARVRMLKHNRAALRVNAEESLVFLTRCNLPYYREHEIHGTVTIANHSVRKLVGVKIENSISGSFGRAARELGLDGVSFYRLRHTFKTLGKKARDGDALNLMMGHKDSTVSRIYDHEDIGWRRIKRVSRKVYRQLWSKTQPKVRTRRPGYAVPKYAGDVQERAMVLPQLA